MSDYKDVFAPSAGGQTRPNQVVGVKQGRSAPDPGYKRLCRIVEATKTGAAAMQRCLR